MDAKTLLLGGLGVVLVLYLVTIVRGGLVTPTPASEPRTAATIISTSVCDSTGTIFV